MRNLSFFQGNLMTFKQIKKRALDAVCFTFAAGVLTGSLYLVHEHAQKPKKPAVAKIGAAPPPPPSA